MKGSGKHLPTLYCKQLADDLTSSTVRDRRRMQAAADHWLGRRLAIPIIAEGLHYPFLPADEFFDRGHFPWLDRLEAATGDILAELEALLADPDSGLTRIF